MGNKGLREQYLVARIYAKYREEIGLVQYESEFNRWVDLVISLLIASSSVPEVNVEAAVRILISLNLLNVEQCAEMSENSEESKVFSEILREFGFSEEEARKGRKSIFEISQIIEKNWNSKIQYFLRKWGEKMLEDMIISFPIDVFSEKESRYAFSRWLQIALNMPILLEHNLISDFANNNKTTIENIINAADTLDLNVSFLDEAINLENRNITEE